MPDGGMPRIAAASGRLFAAGRSRISTSRPRSAAAARTRSTPVRASPVVGSGIRGAQRVVRDPELVVGAESLPRRVEDAYGGRDTEDDGDHATGADALLLRCGAVEPGREIASRLAGVLVGLLAVLLRVGP